MSRLYTERLYASEVNPLSKIYHILSEQLTLDLSSSECDYFFSGNLALPSYLHYLLWEAVVLHVRKELDTTRIPIYKYLSALPLDDPFSGADLGNSYKRVCESLQLRKEFARAELERFSLLDQPEASWLDEVITRSDSHKGYAFTALQYEQLRDKQDLYIQKKPRFRQFISSKHTTNADVISFYDDLAAHARRCEAEKNVDLRVLKAINLHDYENRNICLFLLRVAEYCVENDVKEIDADSLSLLRWTTCSLSLNDGKTIITHKPVLLMHDLIESAMNKDTEEIGKYISLQLIGLKYRFDFLPKLFQENTFTYEDIWNFFFRPGLYSDIYKLYQSKLPTERAAAVVPILRKLIKHLTIDPLSTSFE